MPKKVNCTELEQAMVDTAIMVSDLPHIKNQRNIVDAVVSEMSQNIPAMNRDLLMSAVKAAVGNQERVIQAIADIVGSKAFNREAKKDVRLRGAIAFLSGHLKAGTLPDIINNEAAESDMIQALEQAAEGLRWALRNSKPAVQKRLEDDIKTLEERIARFLERGSEQEPQAVPLPKGLESLAKRRRDLQNHLTRMKRAYAQEQAVLDQIHKIATHLRGGTMPEKAKRPESTAGAALQTYREARDALLDALNRQPAAELGRRNAMLDRLAAKLKQLENGTYVKPVKRPSALSEKVQRDLDYKRYRLESEIQRHISNLRPRSFWGRAAEGLNMSRALMTSYDFSGVIRQGGFVAFGHPLMALRAMKKMFKATVSQKRAREIHQAILDSEDAPLMRAANLEITDLDSLEGLSQQEEIFMSRWLNSLPNYKTEKAAARIVYRKVRQALGLNVTEPEAEEVIRKRQFLITPFRAIKSGVHGSQRAYVTYLNQLRVDLFRTMYENLAVNGEPTIEEARAIANLVNVATGRGNLGSAQKFAVGANTLFFAPRYVTSRFQTVLLQPLFGKDARAATWRTRRAIAKEYARYMVGISMFHALVAMAVAAMADDDDEFWWDTSRGAFGVGDYYSVTYDLRSTDAFKMRFGNARLEPMSGLGQIATLVSRGLTGQTRTSKGEIKPLRKPILFGDREKGPGFIDQDMGDKLGDFVRYKFSPIVAYGLEIATQKDAVGQDVTPLESTLKLAAPLSGRDLVGAFHEGGIIGGTALYLSSIFGFGLNVYENKGGS